ncbi:MAG: integrase arm-type DNA-binding domain-containing protein [Alphaproteobacteria bacterium]|nr:integrase arm-type DNA-binding domain-containing protein [Alphaproteobacteria bacterium]
MGLSALAIKAAKSRDRQYKLTDADGLYLLVMPSGNRYWRMNYRFADKHKTLAFGVYPQVSLAEARTRRDEAKKILSKRIDPLEQQRLDRIEESIAAANTFGVIANEWLIKIEKDGISPVTLKKTRWLISLTNPALTNRSIAEISPHELLAVLRKVEARGRLNSAGRLRSTGPA